MQWRWAATLILSLSLYGGVLGKDKPKVASTKFKSIPSNLFYFEDSDVVLVTDSATKTAYRSSDAGEEWEKLDGVNEGEVLEVLKHPYDNKVAVVIGTDKKHWVTKDQGKSWSSWKCDAPPTLDKPAISFHADDADRMLYHAAHCKGFECDEEVYYTKDGFESKPKLLLKDAAHCLWAKSTDLFTTGSKDLDKNQILCIVKGAQNPFMSGRKVLTSSNFFEDSEEPSMTNGRSVSGVMQLAAVKHYMVAAAKSEGTTELAMFVTDDASTWHRAEFGEHKLEQDAYTLLESTNYSMQVDVLTTKPTSPMGVLLTSNSNGTFFTTNVEHTNRNMRGFVDFEKVQNIQGIVMVNTVDNWEDVERNWLAEKEVTSQISFDDGRTWQSLKAGDDKLHLHSVTDQRNIGRIFSSPAPGIVLGVGNTGKYLKPYEECDLYVSDDAGLTWSRTRKRPHFYEFGGKGSLLVAVEDDETNAIWWSLDHGESWDSFELEDKVRPLALTTVPDSTSLKFVLVATEGRGRDLQHYIYSLDFEKLDAKECKKGDFEEWYARKDDDGEPGCIMGHKQKYRRRKKDAKCLVSDDDFEEPLPIPEDCKCTKDDFECDYENGFTHEDGKCVLTGVYPQPEGACTGKKETFKGSSGYRLIPGNTCNRKGGEYLDEEVDRQCKELDKPVASGKVASEVTTFQGDTFVEYYYLERKQSNKGHDETVIMRTDRRDTWLTHDHGKTWSPLKMDEEIVAIYPHQYLSERVYLITPSKKVYYSTNRGDDFHSFDAPEEPNVNHLQILTFHPDQPDWLIWTGGKDCTSRSSCQTIAHASQKNGDEWNVLLRSVRKCQFVWREDRTDSDQLIFCEQYEDEDMNKNLLLKSSDDFFSHGEMVKRDVINFASMAEYIVVAVRDPEEDNSLRVDTSIDGRVFANAKFPPNFNVDHQQAYTVLDSSTHAVFLHVTVNNMNDQEYGSIIKSNSNGTSYVLSIGEVNRNGPGFVDFEKMQGLEGVAVINRVANVKETDKGNKKKLKTWITHNDGADWALLPRPDDPPKKVDRKYECKKGASIEKCSLHLHGYTERKDPRDTFSSASAIGMMMATGNVGEFLGFKKEADTFITRDGGLTWQFAAPGNWMWEYGDQGSIIVIVKEDEPTNEVLYSLDEGREWKRYTFSDSQMAVEDITTVPSDTSRNFLLWGRIKGDLTTVNLDFSGLEERSRPCKQDESGADYELWSPKHPLSQDDCLFGHVAQYHRKKLDAECFNGEGMQDTHIIKQNCSCTRQDFECDYNFERQKDGSCSLVQGLKEQDPKDMCKKEGVKEFWHSTGYRRIPLTTCEGGVAFDYTPSTQPCPGFEEDWQRKHGISAAGLFFAITIPIGVAAAAGYYVWKHWDGKFGRIQLGDGPSLSSTTGYNAFDRDAPWIRFPVLAVSGIVAVLAALPMVVGSVWNAVSSRLGRSRGYGYGGVGRPYTSRASFARGGRGNYAVVGDDDEGELLGDDSEDEV